MHLFSFNTPASLVRRRRDGGRGDEWVRGIEPLFAHFSRFMNIYKVQEEEGVVSFNA